jgi:prepilin-type N-terminal cleavage/methylation domain-containing protein
VRTRDAAAGFTLVEILVTIVVGSLVAVAVFTFFAGQQRIYETHRRALSLQQSLWMTGETLARFVRLSGTGMMDCVRPDADGNGPDTGDPPPAGLTVPQTGLRVFRNGAGVFRIPPIWIRNGAAGAPDRLQIAYGSGSYGSYADTGLQNAVSNATATITLPTANPSLASIFQNNDFFLLLDRSRNPASGNLDRGCTLMRVTGVDTGTHVLSHASTSEWNPGSLVANYVPFTYGGGGNDSAGGVRHFGQLTWLEFSVDTTGTIPRLMMQRLDGTQPAQVLAEGIEDLQIAYGCDGFPAPNVLDGQITEGTGAGRLTDEWIYNVASDVPPPGCNKPVALRLSIFARSLGPDDTLNAIGNNRKPAAEDGALGAVDQFRHRMTTVTVFLRN